MIDKLEDATLIVGNVKDTLPKFVEKYKPAPVGVIALDMDLYTSAVPVMNWLSHPDYTKYIRNKSEQLPLIIEGTIL